MDTKEKIITAAAQEFSEKGFLRTTMRAISKCAGINHAGINYHFSTKKDLYFEVMVYLFEKTAGFEAHPRENIASSRAWKNAIYEYILRVITNMSDPNKFMRWKHKIIFREMVEPTNMLPLFYDRFIKPEIENLKNYLRLGLPENCPADELNFRLLLVMSQCAFYEQNREFVRLIAEDGFFNRKNLERLAGCITENICRDLKFRKI